MADHNVLVHSMGKTIKPLFYDWRTPYLCIKGLIIRFVCSLILILMNSPCPTKLKVHSRCSYLAKSKGPMWTRVPMWIPAGSKIPWPVWFIWEFFQDVINLDVMHWWNPLLAVHFGLLNPPSHASCQHFYRQLSVGTEIEMSRKRCFFRLW